MWVRAVAFAPDVGLLSPSRSPSVAFGSTQQLLRNACFLPSVLYIPEHSRFNYLLVILLVSSVRAFQLSPANLLLFRSILTLQRTRKTHAQRSAVIMRSTFTLGLFALAGLSAAQEQYQIDPDTVQESTRDYWCQQQKSVCPQICLQQDGVTSMNTVSNECDAVSYPLEPQ